MHIMTLLSRRLPISLLRSHALFLLCVVLFQILSSDQKFPQIFHHPHPHALLSTLQPLLRGGQIMSLKLQLVWQAGQQRQQPPPRQPRPLLSKPRETTLRLRVATRKKKEKRTYFLHPKWSLPSLARLLQHKFLPKAQLWRSRGALLSLTSARCSWATSMMGRGCAPISPISQARKREIL